MNEVKFNSIKAMTEYEKQLKKQGALEYKKRLKHILNYGIWKELTKEDSKLFDGMTSARVSYIELIRYIKNELKELEGGDSK